MGVIDYPVSFNAYTLDLIPGVSVLDSNPYTPAQRSVVLDAIARTNRRKIKSAFFTGKQIKVGISINRVSRELAEQAFELLMEKLTGEEKELIVRQGLTSTGTKATRRYTATLVDAPIKVAGGSYMQIDLIFECSDSFGYDVSPTTLLTTPAVTASTRTDALTFAGSAPWQAPTITITYGTITGGTGKTVLIGNPAIGQQVTISRDFITSDILVIDAINNSIKVNGTEVRFTGAIPQWQPGAGTWSYSDTLTTRSFVGSIVYNKRYI